MSRFCLALLLALALWLASPVAAQRPVPAASVVAPALDDTDPEVELVWLPLACSIGWVVWLRGPG